MSRAKKTVKPLLPLRKGLSFGPREARYAGCVGYEVRWDDLPVGTIFGYRDYLGWNYEGYLHIRMSKNNERCFVWESERSRSTKPVKSAIKKFFAQLQPT